MGRRFDSIDHDLEFIGLFFEELQRRAPARYRDYVSSLRRSKSMAQYLVTLYMRAGARAPEHYIEAAGRVLVPELEELGRQIALEILLGRQVQPEQPKGREGSGFEEDQVLQGVLSYIWGETPLVDIIRGLKTGDQRKDAERLRQFIRLYEELTGRTWAGPGRDRLFRWSRWNSPASLEVWKLTELVIKVGRGYSKRFAERRGQSGEYRLRPFEIGDDPDAVDYEATIESLRDQGRRLDHLRYEDILVRDARRERLTITYLHDISGSMGNLLLVTNVILASLIQVFKDDRFAVGLFTDDFYVMKELDEYQDVDLLTRDVVSLYPQSGTVLVRGIDWARQQFQKVCKDSEKICFILGDFRFYWPELTYEGIDDLQRNGVKVIRLSIQPMVGSEAAVSPLIQLNKILEASKSAEELVTRTLDEVYKAVF